MGGRTGRGADAAVQAAIQLVVVAQVGLDILKYLLQLVPTDWRRIRYRIAYVFLNSGRR